MKGSIVLSACVGFASAVAHRRCAPGVETVSELRSSVVGPRPVDGALTST